MPGGRSSPRSIRLHGARFASEIPSTDAPLLDHLAPGGLESAPVGAPNTHPVPLEGGTRIGTRVTRPLARSDLLRQPPEARAPAGLSLRRCVLASCVARGLACAAIRTFA